MPADSRSPGSKSQLKNQHGFGWTVVSWAREFCVLTGFHGYKYVGMPGQFYIERIFWAVIIVTAMIVAFYLVWTAWANNLTRPILITVETSHFPIWNIPFPAVTICDLNKIGLSAARRLADTWRLPNNTSPDQVLADLTLLSELVQSHAYVNITGLERLQQVLDLNGVGIHSVIEQENGKPPKTILRTTDGWDRAILAHPVPSPECRSEKTVATPPLLGWPFGVKSVRDPGANKPVVTGPFPGPRRKHPVAHLSETHSRPTAITSQWSSSDHGHSKPVTSHAFRTAPQPPTCRFKGRVRDCSTLFKMVRTSEGLCCSFNYFGEKRKVNGTHVPAVDSFKQDAARTSACGAEMGLSVFMHTRMDDYYVTLMASRGFKVLLHGSFDFPADNVPSWLLPVGNEMLLSLSPEVMYSTPRSTEYTVSKRGCLFQRELQLKHFKSYSYHNCLVECRYNRTLELCGCAPALQPTSDHEKICNLADVPCLHKYKDELETLSSGPEDEDSRPCDCKPECDSLHYEVDLSEGELSSQEAPIDKQFLGEVKDMTNYSLLHVFFVDLVGTRYRRDVYFTWRNLLASFGGLLGLLLGFSLTSGIEMVYFFTLRPLGQLLRTACHSPTPSQDDGTSKALGASYHQHQVKRGRRMAWNCIRTSALSRKQKL